MIPSLLANAIVLSAVFVTFSMGFTLVYGSFRVMNMAHGAMLTVGAFVALFLSNNAGLPLGFAAVAGVLAAGTINAVMNILVIRPIQRRTLSLTSAAEELTPVIATIAVAGISSGIIFNIAGGLSYVFQNAQWISSSVEVGGAHISILDIIIVVLAIALTIGLNLLISQTPMGIRIRAVAEDNYMAEALGVRSGFIAVAVFFITGALAGLTGIAVGLLNNNVNPVMGEQLLLLGFIIVTVGGIGSLKGTIIAAVIVAFIRTFASTYLPVPIVTLILFGILLLVLVIRPAGIMGARVFATGVKRS
jgi:branched-chain amino acid transport system permease protein